MLTQENLAAFQPDPSSKVEIYVFSLQRLFTIHNSPLVVAFAYDSQTSFVFGLADPATMGAPMRYGAPASGVA